MRVDGGWGSCMGLKTIYIESFVILWDGDGSVINALKFFIENSSKVDFHVFFQSFFFSFFSITGLWPDTFMLDTATFESWLDIEPLQTPFSVCVYTCKPTRVTKICRFWTITTTIQKNECIWAGNRDFFQRYSFFK